MTGNSPTEAEYEIIRQLVYDRSRINLGTDKRELVAARLGKRLRALQLSSYRDYCNYLRSPNGNAELQNLVDVISTNHTYFFREPQHFEFIEHHVIPDYLQNHQRKGNGRLRIWSSACSSGEEPYSIAICLETQRTSHPRLDWELDASDISTQILASARKGVYTEERLSGVPLDTKRRFFQKGVGPYAGYYRMKAEVRDKISWHQMNLFDPSWPFTEPFHVIFCRNVMIYFDRPSQEELVARMSRLLVPGGYLMIGHSESLSGVRHSLKSLAPAIYRRTS